MRDLAANAVHKSRHSVWIAALHDVARSPVGDTVQRVIFAIPQIAAKQVVGAGW